MVQGQGNYPIFLIIASVKILHSARMRIATQSDGTLRD